MSKKRGLGFAVAALLFATGTFLSSSAMAGELILLNGIMPLSEDGDVVVTY
jgi:hypothetical protein